MKVWLIREGEALPVMENVRLMRMGMLAQYLSEQGHQVTWWASTYIHGKKEYYCEEYRELKVNDHLELILLHSPISYKKNVSVSRLCYNARLSREFVSHSKKEEVPDIILCSWPTPDFAREAVRYGKRHHVPVILDARDCWPDIFYRPFPKQVQWFVKLCLLPMKYSAYRTFKQADGITGMSQESLRWGCHYAGREPGRNDKCIYIGNYRIDRTPEKYATAVQQWAQLGVTTETWNICFISTMGRHLDLETLILAVKELVQQGLKIKLIIGGDGDMKAYYQHVADDTEYIIFAGWLDGNQMNSLMQLSKCGAYSLRNTEDFIDTFSNKAIQYLAAGLPVLNSLKGFARTFLYENQMGLTYMEGDVKDCAEKIRSLYFDEILRSQMSQNAVEKFEDMFEASKVNKEFEEYLLSFVKECY